MSLPIGPELLAGPGGALYEYLNQTEIWVPRGRAPVRIAEMDRPWRSNAARWLVRHATRLASHRDLIEISQVWVGHALGHPPAPTVTDPGREERCTEPQRWVRSTPLYLALRAGLTAADAELARHRPVCAKRAAGPDAECTCGPLEGPWTGQETL